MSADWNYAQLSKAAAAAGGPEAFVKGLQRAANLALAGAYAAGGVTVLAAGVTVAQVKRYRRLRAEAEQAERALGADGSGGP